MPTFYAREALTDVGWRADVRLTVSTEGPLRGQISKLELDRPPQPEDYHFKGPLIPGGTNVHSHSFQRVIAGRTERRSSGAESHFWTWRQAMYEAVSTLTPEQIEACAALCFVEQLKGGYTSVGEFHYLHHSLTGRPYSDSIELSRRVIEAAQTANIALTHLPVLYRWSDMYQRPPQPEQGRFICTIDQYSQMIERLAPLTRSYSNLQIGLAPHSLRAVSPEDLRELTQLWETLGSATTPVHIHISEQLAEVQQCLEAYGARPVEWLFDHAPINERWCMVHATHLSEAERQQLAHSKVVVGLCPTTEANLGDGFFDIEPFLHEGGAIAVGSDSNVDARYSEELRLLEYGQRLRHQRRNICIPSMNASPSPEGDLHVGAHLLREAGRGGGQALNRVGGVFEGAWADWVVLDEEDAGLWGRRRDELLDAWLFSSRGGGVRDVFVGGTQVVDEGRHIAEEYVTQRFRTLFK